MKRLIEFIALQSALTGEDIKKIIRKAESQIKKISRREVEEATRRNILYINLGNVFGVALIGHTVSDGSLSEQVKGNVKFIYFNAEQHNIRRVRKLLKYFGYRGSTFSRKRSMYKQQEFSISESGLIAQAIRRAIPRVGGKKTVFNPLIPHRITGNWQKAIALLQSIAIDEANVGYRCKLLRISLSLDVTEEIGKENVERLIELVKDRLQKVEPERNLVKEVLNILTEERLESLSGGEVRTILERSMKHLEKKGLRTDETALKKVFKDLSKESEITRGILKYYLRYIEKKVRVIRKNEVSSELVRCAESKTNNILEAVARAFKTLGINIKNRGIQNFYVSRNDRLTAHIELFLSGEDVDRVDMFGIIKGYKKRNYLAIVERKSIRLFDKKKGEGKLSKSQLDLLEGEKVERIYCSRIEKYEDIMDIIYNNKPRDLEEKYRKLIEKGVKADLEPERIKVGKRFVSVQWCLVYWPPNLEPVRED